MPRGLQAVDLSEATLSKFVVRSSLPSTAVLTVGWLLADAKQTCRYHFGAGILSF